MPPEPGPLALDERTAQFGRELFAEVRQQHRDEQPAEEKQGRRRRDDRDDGSPWDALFGDGDADGSDGD